MMQHQLAVTRRAPSWFSGVFYEHGHGGEH